MESKTYEYSEKYCGKWNPESLYYQWSSCLNLLGEISKDTTGLLPFFDDLISHGLSWHPS